MADNHAAVNRGNMRKAEAPRTQAQPTSPLFYAVTGMAVGAIMGVALARRPQGAEQATQAVAEGLGLSTAQGGARAFNGDFSGPLSDLLVLSAAGGAGGLLASAVQPLRDDDSR